jgi:hypothetical protein
MRSTSHALEWIELNPLLSLIAMLLVVLLQGYYYQSLLVQDENPEHHSYDAVIDVAKRYLPFVM